MSVSNPPQEPTNDLREDEFMDNMWGRALDMTSDDFKNDKVYLKAQANYKKVCRAELETLLACRQVAIKNELIDEILGQLPEPHEQKLNNPASPDYDETKAKFYRDGGRNFVIQEVTALLNKMKGEK